MKSSAWTIILFVQHHLQASPVDAWHLDTWLQSTRPWGVLNSCQRSDIGRTLAIVEIVGARPPCGQGFCCLLLSHASTSHLFLTGSTQTKHTVRDQIRAASEAIQHCFRGSIAFAANVWSDCVGECHSSVRKKMKYYHINPNNQLFNIAYSFRSCGPRSQTKTKKNVILFYFSKPRSGAIY